MPNITDWKTVEGTVFANPDKRVTEVSLELVASDSVIRNDQNQDVPIYFTDIQFQAGGQRTGWVPNTEEMLKLLKYNDYEKDNAGSTDIFLGSQPLERRDLTERQFNIVGRGHSVVTIPNYYITSIDPTDHPEDNDLPKDYLANELPTGLDLTLVPKEDFTVLRVSTNYGAFEPDPEKRRYQKVLIDEYPGDQYIYDMFYQHPLHYRYTREFWVDGGPGSAGSEIKINARTRVAQINGTDIPIGGEYTFNVEGSNGYSWPLEIGRKQFFLAPKGSLRLRVEFYQMRNLSGKYGGAGYQRDTGVGFYGTARFNQWTYGRSRI